MWGRGLTLICLCGNVVANPMRLPATQEDVNLPSNISVSQLVAASCRTVPKRSTGILICSVYIGVGANFVFPVAVRLSTMYICQSAI